MIKELDKILAWVKIHSPQTLQHLNSPASEDSISDVEAAVGYQIPTMFKELLKYFDGEDGQTWLALFGNGNQMLSCEMIIEQFKIGQEIREEVFEPEMDTVEFWKDRIESSVIFVRGSVKPLLHHSKWLPFTCMNGDVFRYLDFDPAPGGVEGQVIEVDPEGCSYQVLANGLEEALTMYANQLESGKYKVGDDGYIEMIENETDTRWGMPEWLKQIE